MPSALLTDLYELNMAASYLRRGMDEEATFSLFVRRLRRTAGSSSPPDSSRAWRSSRTSASRRRSSRTWARPWGSATTRSKPSAPSGSRATSGRPRGPGRPAERAVARAHGADRRRPAGRDLPAQRPHVPDHDRLEGGPLPHRRRGPDLVDFSFRRTQGTDAAMAVARATAMVGFAATSNVEPDAGTGCRSPGRWRTRTSSPSPPRGTPSSPSPPTSPRGRRSSWTRTTRATVSARRSR